MIEVPEYISDDVKKLAYEIYECGYAKCVKHEDRLTARDFDIGEVGSVKDIGLNSTSATTEETVSISFHDCHHFHYLVHFEVPTEKEIILYQLK